LGLNWKAGVALVSGAAAKEIIVSTLGVLYSDEQTQQDAMQLKMEAEKSLEEMPQLQEKVAEKIEAKMEEEDILLKYQILRSGDYTAASALAFMVFALLYFPCIATLATISNETGSWKWALFSFLYSCSIAWVLSFVIYNIANLF